MGFSCGIIGLPNVGKSTIFNALTRLRVSAENYPFTTIEPNIGIVDVVDERVDVIAKVEGSKNKVYTTLKFVDIAGLVKGASKGEGLGNRFLNHIREVDAIACVVRCFVNREILHVEGDINPKRDIGIINTELLLADLETVERRMEKVLTSAKSGNKKFQEEAEFLQKLSAHLTEGKKAKDLKPSQEEAQILRELNLLTAKPTMYVANTGEDGLSGRGEEYEFIKQVEEEARKENAEVVVVSGKLEAELAELEESERLEYLRELGIMRSGLDLIIEKGNKLLNLITFFTTNPKEAHAWTIVKGTKAPQAGGKIHSDFERGFIKAEIVSYSDFVKAGCIASAREQGLLRIEGKDYIMQDGDIAYFKFNVRER